jgi:hypothetical protein
VIRAGLLVAACLSMLLGVAVHGQRSLGARAMRESDLALARGRWRDSAKAARLAAEAAVPGSPYPARGYARLSAIATISEAAGRTDDAAFAWRAMRSAARATWPAEGTRDEVALAEEGILRVARAPAAPSRPGGGTDPSAGVPSAPESILRAQLAASR